jgi:Tol biopolymer transport system component
MAIAILFAVTPQRSKTGNTPVPVTSFRGNELNPALSPDGSQVAFAWAGERNDNFDIYVMALGSGTPSRLTSYPADDVAPSWSPDGRTIAFVRRMGGVRGELYLIPAQGGTEHRIGEVSDVELRQSPPRLVSLAWSPDGRWIAASHREPGDSTQRIYLFSRTGSLRPLTSPPAPSSDHRPAFSQDGRALAFCRLPGWSTSDIYTQALDSELRAVGAPQRLTPSGRWSVHPVWRPAGDQLLYLSADEPGAPHELRITATAWKSNGRTISFHDRPMEIAAAGDRLVYSTAKQDSNIWRARIPRTGGAPSEPELFIASTRKDDRPRYSPDGRMIAFTSSRSGSQEIWLAKADGSSPTRLTSFGGPLVGYGSWSPDGRTIVFHARPEGQADVYVIPAAGGPATRLTTHPADDTMASYSQDGKWIYFSSARSGTMEIWRMSSNGSDATQLTSSGGHRPLESSDGKRIFYNSLDGSRIRSIPVAGGPPSDVRGPLHSYPSAFAITPKGIYYESPPQAGGAYFIRFYGFNTGEDRPVALARHLPFLGMTVSPDETHILFDQFDEYDLDLMLVSEFRP